MANPDPKVNICVVIENLHIQCSWNLVKMHLQFLFRGRGQNERKSSTW